MSISYCAWCERLAEGNTECLVEYGREFTICKDCGEEITELSEDEPEGQTDE